MRFSDDLTKHHDAMWKAVLAKVEEIESQHKVEKAWYGASRSAAMYGQRDVSTILDIGMRDGTHRAYHIKASMWSTWANKIDVRVKRYFHNDDEYWEKQIANEPETRVVVDSTHYRLGKNGARRGPHNGFAGARWDIEFLDGRKVTTYDLWYQGTIPPVFRDQLPDNARFVSAADAEIPAPPQLTGE